VNAPRLEVIELLASPGVIRARCTICGEGLSREATSGHPLNLWDLWDALAGHVREHGVAS
jgi:hypothetical protein